MDVLARGANFEIRADAGIVRCSVVNSSEVSREEGARCAQLMREILVSRVVTVGSPYVGLVMDLRHGPEVFGPVTRGMLEAIFQAAETSRRRLAVRVGPAAVQRLQFSSLCRECAPRVAKIVDRDEDEVGWLRGEG